MGVLCTWVKLLTDLQIVGCALHKPPEPAGSYSAAPDSSAVIRGGEGREEDGNGWEQGRGKGREGKDVQGYGGMGRGREGNGGRSRRGRHGKERGGGSTWIFVEGRPSS